MKRSLVLGSIVGTALTLIAAYFLLNSNALKSPSSGRTGTASIHEKDDVPLMGTFSRYELDFRGREDLLAHRAKLAPFATLETWDKAVTSAKLNSVRLTSACRIIGPTRAIFVPQHQTEGILSTKINLHFSNGDHPTCFGVGLKIAIVEDSSIDGKTLYKFIADATVDRILEMSLPLTNGTFFREISIFRPDIIYLANTNYAPTTNFGPVTALHFTLNPTKTVLEPNVVPDFVPGAISIAPDELKNFFFSNPKMGKPVLVDARDRAHAKSAYHGAISVPFVPSNPIQTRFQIDFPLSLLAGAKFDLRALPAFHETPLVIFGDDASDASPLWVIRALRMQNYHRLFYLKGGFQELQKLRTPITF